MALGDVGKVVSGAGAQVDPANNLLGIAAVIGAGMAMMSSDACLRVAIPEAGFGQSIAGRGVARLPSPDARGALAARTLVPSRHEVGGDEGAHRRRDRSGLVVQRGPAMDTDRQRQRRSSVHPSRDHDGGGVDVRRARRLAALACRLGWFRWGSPHPEAGNGRVYVVVHVGCCGDAVHVDSRSRHEPHRQHRSDPAHRRRDGRVRQPVRPCVDAIQSWCSPHRQSPRHDRRGGRAHGGRLYLPRTRHAQRRDVGSGAVPLCHDPLGNRYRGSRLGRDSRCPRRLGHRHCHCGRSGHLHARKAPGAVQANGRHSHEGQSARHRSHARLGHGVRHQRRDDETCDRRASHSESSLSFAA